MLKNNKPNILKPEENHYNLIPVTESAAKFCSLVLVCQIASYK